MRTIAHISDIHFGRFNPVIGAALRAALRPLAPDLLIISGDLTQRARTRQFKDAASFLHALPIPQLVVPGNHDVPLYDLFRRFFNPLQMYRRHIAHDLWPMFEDDELFVVGVNTTRACAPRLKGFWKDGGISSDQLKQLRALFSAAPARRLKILVTHHPFIPAPGGDPDDVIHHAAAGLAAAEAAGVDLLLAGHLHRSYNGFSALNNARTLLSIQAASATSTRLRHNEPNAFNLIRAAGHAVELIVYAFDGSGFCPQAAQRFVRGARGWSAAP